MPPRGNQIARPQPGAPIQPAPIAPPPPTTDAPVASAPIVLAGNAAPTPPTTPIDPPAQRPQPGQPLPQSSGYPLAESGPTGGDLNP